MKIDRISTGSVNQINNSNTRSNSNSKIDSERYDIPAIDGEKSQVQPDGVAKIEDDSVEPDYLKKSIEQANKSLKLYDREIVREVHEKTKTVMYTIKDTKTHEVISEFPPKKIQDMIAKMWELAGLFVDEKG